jgi:hypothetical protein
MKNYVSMICLQSWNSLNYENIFNSIERYIIRIKSQAIIEKLLMKQTRIFMMLSFKIMLLLQKHLISKDLRFK